jgi:hypothetical protein
MGGNVDTGTQTSGLTIPEMKAAAGTIGNQLNTQLQSGVKPYTESMVPNLSGQTTAGLSGLTNNPNNSIFSSGVSGTLGQQAQLAQGNFGADPVRSRLIDDTATAVNASLQGSGRYGSGSHKQALVDQIGNSLGSYDNARQQQAIGNLGALYGMSNMPASANLQAGQIMDQWNAAKAEDNARIFDATQNAGWNTLQRGSSIFAGTAPVSGTTTTQSQPWWKVGGSMALGGLSLFG